MPETNYIWDPISDSYLMETDESHAAATVYTVEPEPFGKVISQRRGNEKSYYHYDGLGSTRELTDESGSVTDTNLYDAWGREMASSGVTENPFRWIGELGYYWNVEFQQQYVRARPYRPAIGRWLALDPLFLSSAMGDAQYLYTHNNPLSGTDPSGQHTIGARIRSVTLKGKFNDWLALEKKDGAWWANLPKCPCSIEFDCQDTPVNPDDDVWQPPKKKRDFPRGLWGIVVPELGTAVLARIFSPPDLHPGAVWDMRLKKRVGDFGNQCTYDKAGKLITGGLGAGTVDKRYYGEVDYDTFIEFVNIGLERIVKTADKWRHFQHDVVPFWAAWILDGKTYGANVAQYLQVRPPHVGDCEENVVGGTPADSQE